MNALFPLIPAKAETRFFRIAGASDDRQNLISRNFRPKRWVPAFARMSGLE
jgi:hypothetical protein